VAVTVLIDAAVVAPNNTRVVPVMLVPVMVTLVPPVVDPELGVTLVMIGGGGATKENPENPVTPFVVDPYDV
jgi:hypothetical protein